MKVYFCAVLYCFDSSPWREWERPRLASNCWGHRRREEQRHPGLIVSRWPAGERWTDWKNCPHFQMPQSPQLALLPHRPFWFSITFLNPPGRLCTHHTQTHANIHTQMHTLSRFASDFHYITSRWMCVGSFHWCMIHTNHNMCQQTMEKEPQQSESEGQPWRQRGLIYIHTHTHRCIVLHFAWYNVQHWVVYLQLTDWCVSHNLLITRWLKPWKVCLGKRPSGFHMSYWNNSYYWLETKKYQHCWDRQLAEGLVASWTKSPLIY